MVISFSASLNLCLWLGVHVKTVSLLKGQKGKHTERKTNVKENQEEDNGHFSGHSQTLKHSFVCRVVSHVCRRSCHCYRKCGYMSMILLCFLPLVGGYILYAFKNLFLLVKVQRHISNTFVLYFLQL